MTALLRFVIGVAARPADGEDISGDAVRVIESRDGVLVAIADGLGHGRHAAEAANAFCDYVSLRPSSSLEVVMSGANERLASTRGAVAFLLRLRATGRVELCGVGNIAFHAQTASRVSGLSLPGIVGRIVRRPRVFDGSIAPGDLFVLHTDGVSSRFDLEGAARTEPGALAQAIIVSHRRGHDDAACAVVRCEST